MSRMNFLVTGATGFIGSRVVDRLLASGHTVHYLGRKESARLSGRAVFQQWDGTVEPRLRSLPRFAGVVHLAGEPVAQRWTSEVKTRIFDSRVTATAKLVTALGRLDEKPEVLVAASAVGYYGNRGDEILTEKSPPGQGFLAEVCVAWERAALQARKAGIRVATARISTVLGNGGGALEKMLPPFRLGLGGKFGDGRQWMSWIHVDDLVDLLLYALYVQSASGPLNASAPEPVTNADFTRRLAEAVHRPALFAVPKFALRIGLGEMSNFLFDSLRVVPEETGRIGFNFRYSTVKEALRDVLS